MNTDQIKQDKKKDIKILYAFLAFFGVIFIVNGIFIYNALRTKPGVVTEKAYEKGLKYNDLIKEAKSQPSLNDEIAFEKGQLTWRVKDHKKYSLDDADVYVRLIRPIKEGYDMDVKLAALGNGVFSAPVTLPLKGRWQVMIEAKWNNQTYKTSQMILHH